MRFIESIEELKEMSEHGLDCYIDHGRGFQTNLRIEWHCPGGYFKICYRNEGVEQELTDGELFDKRKTDIGEAILQRRLKSYW